MGGDNAPPEESRGKSQEWGKAQTSPNLEKRWCRLWGSGEPWWDQTYVPRGRGALGAS